VGSEECLCDSQPTFPSSSSFTGRHEQGVEEVLDFRGPGELADENEGERDKGVLDVPTDTVELAQ
jgi:hypothetical protein